MRLEKIWLRFDAVSAMIEKLTKLFVTECEPAFVVCESALGQIEQCLGDANRLRQPVASTKRFELVVENVPKLFLAFHCASPALGQLANQARRQFFGGKWEC